MRIVLLSGGLDSSVAYAMASHDSSTFAVVVDYGQKNRTELFMAGWQMKRRGNRGSLVKAQLPMDVGLISGNVDRDRPLNEIGAIGDKPRAHTPGRNTLLLSIALHVAEVNDANEIWIGSNKDDQNGYPDCRREYFDAFEQLAKTTGHSIHVISPLISLSKADVVGLGRTLGVDFAHTSSCYYGTECGRCDACVLLINALRGAA